MRAPDRRRPARRTAGSPLLRRGPVAPRARGTSTDGLSGLAEATPSFLRPRRGDSVLSAASPRRLRPFCGLAEATPSFLRPRRGDSVLSAASPRRLRPFCGLAEATPSFLRPRRGDSVLSAASPRRLRPFCGLAEATPSFLRPRRGDSVLSAASPRRLRVRDHVRMPCAPSVAQPVTDRETVIRTESLTKVYPGGIKAVDGLDLAVHREEIFGLLGPN